MGRPINYYLDTSAINLILKNHDKLESFHRLLTSRRITCFIPTPAIHELLAGGTEEHLSSRLMALAELAGRLPSWQIRLATNYMEAIKIELAAPQKRVIEEQRELLDGLASCWREGDREKITEHAVRVSRSVAGHIHSKKQWLFKTDRRLSKTLEERLGQTVGINDACEYINNFSPTADDMWVDAAVELSDGDWDPESIISQPARFPIIHAISHLTFRQCVANAVDATLLMRASFDAQKLLGTFRTKADGGEGDWYDTVIAGPAVYADALISRDRGMLRRCRFMQKNGLVKFDVICIDDLV